MDKKIKDDTQLNIFSYTHEVIKNISLNYYSNGVCVFICYWITYVWTKYYSDISLNKYLLTYLPFILNNKKLLMFSVYKLMRNFFIPGNICKLLNSVYDTLHEKNIKDIEFQLRYFNIPFYYAIFKYNNTIPEAFHIKETYIKKEIKLNIKSTNTASDVDKEIIKRVDQIKKLTSNYNVTDIEQLGILLSKQIYDRVGDDGKNLKILMDNNFLEDEKKLANSVNYYIGETVYINSVFEDDNLLKGASCTIIGFIDKPDKPDNIRIFVYFTNINQYKLFLSEFITKKTL